MAKLATKDRTDLAGRAIRFVRHQVNKIKGTPADAALSLTVAAMTMHASISYPAGVSAEEARDQFVKSCAESYDAIFQGVAKEFQSS